MTQHCYRHTTLKVGPVFTPQGNSGSNSWGVKEKGGFSTPGTPYPQAVMASSPQPIQTSCSGLVCSHDSYLSSVLSPTLHDLIYWASPCKHLSRVWNLPDSVLAGQSVPRSLALCLSRTQKEPWYDYPSQLPAPPLPRCAPSGRETGLKEFGEGSRASHMLQPQLCPCSTMKFQNSNSCPHHPVPEPDPGVTLATCKHSTFATA